MMQYSNNTPITFSGEVNITNEQFTQIIGDTQQDEPKFIVTIPIPEGSVIKEGLVYFKEHLLGSVNNADHSKVDIDNMTVTNIDQSGRGLTVEFKRVGM